MNFLKANPWRVLALMLVLAIIVYQVSGAAWHLQIGKYFYLSGFSTFVDKLEAGYIDYQDKEWEAAGNDFQKFAGSKYKRYAEYLTEDEMHQVNVLKGRYRAIQMKYLTNEAKEGFKNLMDQVGSFVEEMTK